MVPHVIFEVDGTRTIHINYFSFAVSSQVNTSKFHLDF